MDIAQIINDLVDDWETEPYDINCGGCEAFALELLEKLGINPYTCLGTQDGEMLDELMFVEYLVLPSHYWVYYKGKHYDAECPDGAESWKDLPIFARLEKSTEYFKVLENAKEHIHEN